MVERLRDGFGQDMPDRIAGMLLAVLPDFDATGFVETALVGYDELELTQRARSIADALAQYLPADRCRAIALITSSLPEVQEAQRWRGMDAFVLMPFGMFIADHGVDCFEESMTAQYEITKRFTAEFSIRAFLDQRYEPTMARLRQWAADPDDNVRRLVSEGTRPRLPWATRLERFRRDPRPVLELLEALKDDPSEYVSRSVANNLNDIAKDHPRLVVQVCERWWADGGARRRKVVAQGLRTLVKAGDGDALAVLGYRVDAPLRVATASIEPAAPSIGSQVRLSVVVGNDGDREAPAIVDFRVSFAKARGTGDKVFKGRNVVVPARGSVTVAKTVSLRQQTTRTHRPGIHPVAALVNGTAHGIGSFDLRAEHT